MNPGNNNTDGLVHYIGNDEDDDDGGGGRDGREEMILWGGEHFS